MRDIKTKLISSKNSNNIQSRKGKSFGYQVLGFGSGGIVPPQYTIATGGTILTTGDFKTHVFTSSANMVFAKVGNVADYPGCSAAGPAKVDYLVVGGGAVGLIAGGGGGGFRYSYPSPGCNAGTVTIDGAQSIPVTVGGEEADSVFSSITSTAGGRGAHYFSAGNPNNGAGGSGGGGAGAGGCTLASWTGGVGNTPPVSPAQGRNGGDRNATSPNITGAGGGGFGAVGADCNGNGGVGGAIATAFFGPNSGCYGTPGPSAGRWFSGGGGGSLHANTSCRNTGGAGGGGDGHHLRSGQPTLATEAGGTNTGGGGGGGTATSGGGGSGFVAVRYRFQA